MRETTHITLSKDPRLSIADRYRHLSAHHILSSELKPACQALWASHVGFPEVLPLSEVKKYLEGLDLPDWLEKPAWGARFPASLSAAETVGQQEWAEHHRVLATMAINTYTRRLHWVAMNVFLGFYGFAVQSMFNLSSRFDNPDPRLADPELAWALIEAMPPPPPPFYENLWE